MLIPATINLSNLKLNNFMSEQRSRNPVTDTQVEGSQSSKGESSLHHSGSAIPHRDGSAIAPGGGGLAQGVGGDVGKPLTGGAKLQAPFGESKIDGFLDSVNSNAAFNNNLFDIVDKYAPVANIDSAKNAQALTSESLGQIKSFTSATNSEISSNTSIVSQPQQGGGQSH